MENSFVAWCTGATRGHHVVALDVDAVLCGATASDWAATPSAELLAFLRRVVALPRVTVALASEGSIGELTVRSGAIGGTFRIASGGAVMIDPSKRLQLQPTDTVASRLSAIARSVDARSIFYAGPVASLLEGDSRFIAMHVAPRTAVGSRMALLRAVCEPLLS